MTFRLLVSNALSRPKLRETPGSYKTRGPFLESPSNFSGPKSNIQIEL